MIVVGNNLKKVATGQIVAEIVRVAHMTFVEVESNYRGEIDLADLPMLLGTGVFELHAHYERVRVKSAKWRKANVRLSDGRIGTVHNDGTRRLEIPGRETRMVTYYPEWVCDCTEYTDSDYETIRDRYPHASDRFGRAICRMEDRKIDRIAVIDHGGWPAAVLRITKTGGQLLAELVYAGSDCVEPKVELLKKYPDAIYCEGHGRFRTSDEKRTECGF